MEHYRIQGQTLQGIADQTRYLTDQTQPLTPLQIIESLAQLQFFSVKGAAAGEYVGFPTGLAATSADLGDLQMQSSASGA